MGTRQDRQVIRPTLIREDGNAVTLDGQVRWVWGLSQLEQGGDDTRTDSLVHIGCP